MVMDYGKNLNRILGMVSDVEECFSNDDDLSAEKFVILVGLIKAEVNIILAGMKREEFLEQYKEFKKKELEEDGKHLREEIAKERIDAILQKIPSAKIIEVGDKFYFDNSFGGDGLYTLEKIDDGRYTFREDKGVLSTRLDYDTVKKMRSVENIYATEYGLITPYGFQEA